MTKYVISLIAGLLSGVVLFAAAILYNPLTGQHGFSPLAVTDSGVMTLNFSAAPADTIVFTNSGDVQLNPFPERILQLWEEPIRLTSAMATVMFDARNNTAGFGVKFSSRSEESRLLFGEALVDSDWYVYLPGRGSFFLEQSENLWPFVREVRFPAYRSSSDSWKGAWIGNMTTGPGVLNTAIVSGGSGSLQGLSGRAVESLTVRAYTVEDGPVAADGRLLIESARATENPGD